MARKYRITIVLAVLAFLNGVYFVGREIWFGLVWLLLGVLLSARYFSVSVREFIERNRKTLLILYVFLFGIVRFHFYSNGDVGNALAVGILVVFVGVLSLLEIWAERTYADYPR